MGMLNIPYQYINRERISHCDTDYLSIDLTDYPLCGQKYFQLRIVDISDGVSTFLYNDIEYGNSSLTPTDLIELLATAFACPAEYGCNGQEASFAWCLTPITTDKWTSTTIVNDVSDPQPNLNYSISAINVNGISYGILPHLVWSDGSGGNASEDTYDYINEIIEYIEGLNIPQYVGARNLATNGLSDNYQGVGLFELYFTLGSTVTINFSSTLPSTGTMVQGDETVVQLTLTLTNTSTLSTGDVLETFTTTVTDGVQTMGSQATVGSMIPYNIFGDQSLDVNKTWILNGTIATELECARNGTSTGIITPTEIEEAIRGLNDSGFGHLVCGSSIK